MRLPLVLLCSSIASWSALGQTYNISTFAGGGLPVGKTGTATYFPANSVTWLTVDASGTVFFVFQNAVLRMDAQTAAITLVAGNGTLGYSGDNGAATSAQVNGPEGLAVDSGGNLYIADTNSNRVRKVTNGVITTVVGTGISGYNGDNGPANAASLSYPAGLAVDSHGNLFISDRGNNVIREVSNGIITTFAGNGQNDFTGDNGPATAAALSQPYGIAFDGADNLYIVDGQNQRVRKVSNGVITTIAGNGQSGFSGDGGPATAAALSAPTAIAVDGSGVYISDYSNNRVRKVSGGIITSAVGAGNYNFSGDNGPAAGAGINPYGIALDSHGNLFIGDSYNARIRKVSNGLIASVAGGGPIAPDGGSAPGAFLAPAGVAVDPAGVVYFTDYYTNRVLKIANGVVVTVAGTGSTGFGGDNGPATAAPLEEPHGIAFDSAGNLYIADTYNYRIRKVTNGVISTLAGYGGSTYSGDNGPATSAGLEPWSVAVDSNGNIYAADTYNYRVRKISNGIITTVAGTGTSGVSSDGGLAVNAALQYPYAVAVDQAGTLYIADSNRIRKVSNGIITTVAGSGGLGYGGDNGPATAALLNAPVGMAFDSNGNLFIADQGNNAIREVSNGMISTIAGRGSQFGDNGPAIAAQLAAPYSIAVVPGGDLYVGDAQNYRIRLLSPLPPSLGISSSHNGNFFLGQNGLTYTLRVTNAASQGATSGTVTVTDTVPAGLSLVSMSGTGWNCSGNTCTRDDVLEPGSAYPAITVTVNVVADGATQVTNQVAISGGGSAGANASDPTNITAGQSPAAVTVLSPAQGAAGVSLTATLSWTAPVGAVSYAVYFGTSPNPPLAVASTTATTYSPAMTSGVTYYWSVTAVNAFGSTPSVVRSFTTGAPPAAVTAFLPAQGATGVATNAAISWTTPSGAVSYAVYFGTSPTPPLAVSSTTATTYSPAMTPGTTYYWSVTAVNGFGSTPSAVWLFTTVTGATSGYRFVPVTPCRVMDTRGAVGQFGGPSIAAGATRVVSIPQSGCNIPGTAQAYSLNVTVVPPGPLTYLTIWPTGVSQPVVSTLNSFDGRTVANAAIVPAGTNGGISIFVSDTTHVIVDINGYFAPASTAGSMSFYSVTPCRIADTRSGSGAFGAPFMGAGSTRNFVIPNNAACGIPSTAQAYSLNMTVVPHGALGYLTTWPTGQTQPLVSTLNSPDGGIVANAAIVPAGASGGISVYVTNNTDLLIDINGYFAPPGSSDALSLYTLTPCRVVDTRIPPGAPSLPAGGTRNITVPASACLVPPGAQAYSLNVTVVPPASLLYLTAWPQGSAQPVVSTLNSPLGKVLANAAIVPAGASGGVSIYVSDATNLILDINAYFAP